MFAKMGRMKACTRCGVTKPLDGFWRDRRAADGRSSACAQCLNAAQRIRHSTPEFKAYKRKADAEYRVAHLDERRAADAAYRAINRDRINAQVRDWYMANKDYVREYRRANAERSAFHCRTRKARIRGAALRDLTHEQWLGRVDEFGGRCAYCLKTDDNLTIEHLTPISRGGDHTLSNVVPACFPCNSSKKDRTLLEFMAGTIRKRRTRAIISAFSTASGTSTSGTFAVAFARRSPIL